MVSEKEINRKSIRMNMNRPLLIVLAFSLCSAAVAAERPTAFGFAPAVPVKASEVAVTTAPPPLSRLSRPVWHVHIDDDGRVDSVTAASEQWRRHLDYLSEYLKGFRFEAAQHQGKDIASVLPVRILLISGRRYPDVIFPVGFDGSISRQDLFIQALELQGYRMPEVLSFPSFHATLTLRDSVTSVPFTVIELHLDSSGRVRAGQITHEQYPEFGRQLETAVMYAEFTPPRYNDRPIDGTVYLVVSYFPEVSYPTRPYHRDRRDSLALLARQQLQLLPDTIGIARPAMPVRLQADLMRSGKGGVLPAATVSVWVIVDTLGQARATRTDRAASGRQVYINDFLENLSFYPALDFHGRPVPFEGLMVLSRGGRENVRIAYDWLENLSVSAE